MACGTTSSSKSYSKALTPIELRLHIYNISYNACEILPASTSMENTRCSCQIPTHFKGRTIRMRCSISGKLNPTPRFFESASIGLHSWFNPPPLGVRPQISPDFSCIKAVCLVWVSDSMRLKGPIKATRDGLPERIDKRSKMFTTTLSNSKSDRVDRNHTRKISEVLPSAH